MSHDTKINAVPMWDLVAIALAVGDLQKAGINITLQQGGTARMWAGRPKAAEFVLLLPDCKFDVALVRDNPEGPLVPVCDLHAGYIANQIGYRNYEVNPLHEDGTQKTSDEIRGERALAGIGRFAQAYSNHATINAITADGYTIIDQSVDANGDLQLTYI